VSAVDWDGPRRQECPGCSRGPRDKTLGVTVDDRGAVAHCFRCEFTAAHNADGGLNLSALKRGPVVVGDDHGKRPTLADAGERMRNGRILPRQPLSKHETLSDYGRQLWSACRPISGLARAYLEARACVIPPADGDLRWHPDLKHPPLGESGPALVALVTDAATREPLTLHRTWIRADGTKADFDPPRMLLGGHRKAGGVVRLWPDDAVTEGLGIAEGIETALSLAHAFQPVWALIDAGNLAAFAPLAGIESLLIAADHDDVGTRAADECGRRWQEDGREVGIVTPPTSKADLNDVARAA
jgi:hypothetical protein